ncbi:MAG: response regulator transcription factor [Dissulfuribacterales bacterium]
MFKIVIVDDHPIFCIGLKELLIQEKDFMVCDMVGSIAAARKSITKHRPDMAIIDISLGQENGLDLVREISENALPVFTLVLSMHDEMVWAERALHAGARGYVMKKEASDLIIKAVQQIRNGKIFMSEQIMSHMLERLCGNTGCENKDAMELLTDRELEVFRLIGLGLSTREISNTLNLSIKTVGTYRERIKQKLCIKNSMELTRKAVLWAEKEQPVKT